MKKHSAKYSSWLETHSWDTCKLNLKPLGDFLCDYIVTEKDGFVLSLNGEWGSGKTEFLKRLYAEFLERNNPAIYINAWESDFAKEPLRVISSELINQLKLLIDSSLSNARMDRAKSLLGHMLKGSAITAAQALSKGLFADGDILKNPIEHLLNAEPLDFTNKICEEHENQVQSIANIKTALSEYALSISDADLPVVVLVDELDRCRPDYSIKMLESIKHFFNTKYFVFIIGNDTKQLSASIKALYGMDFSSSQYLKRFFDRSFSLPEPDLIKYLQSHGVRFSMNENFTPHPIDCAFDFIEWLCIIFDNFKMKLRDVDQFLAKFTACHIQISRLERTNHKLYIASNQLLALCIVMHEYCPDDFEKQTLFHPFRMPIRKNYKITPELSLHDYVSLISDLFFIQVYNDDVRIRYRILTNNQHLAWERRIRNSHYISAALKKHAAITRNYKIIRTYDGSFSIPIGPNTDYLLWNDYKKIVKISGLLD